MNQIERLIARVIQVVEDHPRQMILLSIAVNEKGEPICWQVFNSSAEGLQKENTCDKMN